MKRPAGRGVGRCLPTMTVVAVVFGCCAAPLVWPVAAAQAPRVIVEVEPFANISRNPADAWLGVGIAETVAADLGALGLSVIEGRGAGPASGVRWVVSGGYQRLGERLRITARLVAADSGAVVRSVRLDGALDEIFALQDRIVVELTAGVDLRVARRARRRRSAASAVRPAQRIRGGDHPAPSGRPGPGRAHDRRAGADAAEPG